MSSVSDASFFLHITSLVMWSRQRGKEKKKERKRKKESCKGAWLLPTLSA